ncbi:YfbM family protein [Micromonospora sp. CPCC 205539]|uniref:YfbM family protein n=1 Tax=Micromonospora sp. CPCC 205539 TaxID=3122408 RepID=UPI002FF04A18
MNGNWLRVTAADLARAKDDLDWAHEMAQTAVDDEGDRWHCTGKTWHGLDFLLERYGFAVPIVWGAEAFVESHYDDDDDDDDESLDTADWGYGPPRYLTPEQVTAAAASLADLTEEDLLRGVDPGELTRAEVYPDVWDRADQLTWAVHHLLDAKQFFASAATSGDAVICWLD